MFCDHWNKESEGKNSLTFWKSNTGFWKSCNLMSLKSCSHCNRPFCNIFIYANEPYCWCCLNCTYKSGLYLSFFFFFYWVGRQLNYSRFRQDLIAYITGLRWKKHVYSVLLNVVLFQHWFDFSSPCNMHLYIRRSHIMFIPWITVHFIFAHFLTL